MKNILTLYFLTVFHTSLSALPVEHFESLAKGIDELLQVTNSGSRVKLISTKNDLFNQINSYKDASHRDRPFLLSIEKYLRDEDAVLSLKDMRDAFLAMKELLHTERVPVTPDLVAQLFIDLLSGTKKIQNILIVGRTRGGKSTFLATMLDPIDAQLHGSISLDSIFSHTFHPSHHIAIFKSLNDGLFIARFIDTPGLKEVKPVGEENARSDDEVIRAIVENLRGSVIDRVMQLFPIGSSGLNPQDIDAFNILKNALREQKIFDGVIDLVFPRADMYHGDNFDGLINQLSNIFTQKKYAINACDRGALLKIGTLFNADFKMGFSSFIPKAFEVLELRNDVLSHIFGVEFLEYGTQDADGSAYIDDAVDEKLSTMLLNRRTNK